MREWEQLWCICLIVCFVWLLVNNNCHAWLCTRCNNNNNSNSNIVYWFRLSLLLFFFCFIFNNDNNFFVFHFVCFVLLSDIIRETLWHFEFRELLLLWILFLLLSSKVSESERKCILNADFLYRELLLYIALFLSFSILIDFLLIERLIGLLIGDC